MKNYSTVLLLILFSALTICASANESREAPTESCTAGHTVPSDQWRQVSLPCNPRDNNSVADVFGDDIAEAFEEGTPSYDSNWVVYKYVSAADGYVKLEETSPLSVGTGYWIIQLSGNNATLSLPANSTPAPAVSSDACPSDEGCFGISLRTEQTAVGWSMIGRPFGFNPKLGDARIQASTDACTNSCNLLTAKNEELVHDQLWTYDGSTGYTSAKNPDGTLEPWTGYWVATLQHAGTNNPTLLMPKSDVGLAPPNLRSGFASLDGSFYPSGDQSSTNPIKINSKRGEAADEFDFSSSNDGGEITNWDISFDETQSVQMCEIAVNNQGQYPSYFCVWLVREISGAEFDVAIDPSTGIVSVNWPISHFENYQGRLDIGPLKATLTASNASGSSARIIHMVKSNGKPAAEL